MKNNNINMFNEEVTRYYSLNNNKKRIVLVGHSGGNGGAEILLKNLIKEFKIQGFEVIVLVKVDGPIIGEYKQLAPTFVIDTMEKIEYYISELSNYGCKSVILNTTLCGNLISIFHKYNIFCINLVHELPGMIKLLNAEDYVEMVSEQADLVVFPSNYVREKFEESCKVKKQKLIQPQGFYNSYDDFNKCESRKKLETQFNIPYNHSIILNVGKGEFRKGFDLFLDVAKKLKNDNYTFIWVGSIEEHMKELYCEEIKNEENIILTGFLSDKDEIMDYYDACDVFLLTSREDPYPSVVLESFNAKRPVIAFDDAGGFKDIVIDNKTGFLVKYESTDEMVNKIQLICNDGQLKEYLGNNAKKICENHNFQEYVKVLESYCITGEIIISLEDKINSNKKQIQSLNEDIHFLNNEIYSNSNKISYLENNYDKLKESHEKLLSEKNADILKLKQKNKKLNKEKNEILSSSSWKITKPIRQSKYHAKKVFKIKNKFKSKISHSDTKNNSNKTKSDINNKKISKDNYYSIIETYPYSFNSYITFESINRVNIFFDRIDERIYEQTKLFQFIIEYCNKFDSALRIIYNSADFEKLNFFINVNNLKLPNNTSFLNLKKENYIEIGLNEKYVCTSWKNAKRLMNTKSINSIIYYYLDDLSQYDDLEYYRISNLCYNDNVVVLTKNMKKLNQLKNFNYDINVVINKKMSKNTKILCCDFGEHIIEGIELLNHLFLNNILDINKWNVNIISKQKISNFCSNSNNLINQITEELNNYDLLLKINNSNENFLYSSENLIEINIKKIKNENFNSLNISDLTEVYSFDKFVHSSVKIPKEFLEVGKIFKNIEEVN